MAAENGSRALNDDRTTTGKPAIDGDYTLSPKAENIIYAANMRDLGDRFNAAGQHGLEFRVAGSADAWVLITTTTIIKLIANATLVNNTALVSGSERSARSTADPFIVSFREFETEADGLLATSAEVRDERAEAQFSLDFDAAADDVNYEFRLRVPVKGADPTFFLMLCNVATPVAAGGISIPVAMGSYRRRRVP